MIKKMPVASCLKLCSRHASLVQSAWLSCVVRTTIYLLLCKFVQLRTNFGCNSKDNLIIGHFVISEVYGIYMYIEVCKVARAVCCDRIIMSGSVYVLMPLSCPLLSARVILLLPSSFLFRLAITGQLSIIYFSTLSMCYSGSNVNAWWANGSCIDVSLNWSCEGQLRLSSAWGPFAYQVVFFFTCLYQFSTTIMWLQLVGWLVWGFNTHSTRVIMDGFAGGYGGTGTAIADGVWPEYWWIQVHSNWTNLPVPFYRYAIAINLARLYGSRVTWYAEADLYLLGRDQLHVHPQICKLYFSRLTLQLCAGQ